MNELEHKAEDAKRIVKKAELQLQQAELELTHGNRFMDEAREKYGKLKIAVEMAKLEVERERLYLEKVKTDAERGFVEDKT